MSKVNNFQLVSGCLLILLFVMAGYFLLTKKILNNQSLSSQKTPLPPTSTKPTTTTLSLTPIEQLPDKNFSLLRIYQTHYSHERIANFTKVILSTIEIKELYDDIKNLPFWPEEKIFNCPADNGIEYSLNFYSNDVLAVSALVSVTGCPGVSFIHNKYKARMAMNSQGSKLLNDLQQILNLSRQEFYGYFK